MRNLSRTKKAKLNIFSSLAGQAVALVCGLIIPHLLIGEFGSEMYGATASIGSFLSYIALIEGGVGAISRSVLYKALAQKDIEGISETVQETKNFFRNIALIFLVYVLFIACFFRKIANENSFDFWFSFTLVMIIAISTFAEYYIGASYNLLLQADQRGYISTTIRIITTVLNSALVIILVRSHFSLILVKLVSSLVYIVNPIARYIFVKRSYRFVPADGKQGLLSQKKTAFGQHIAWVFHNNTDVVVLTIFGNLSLVAVYSVYNMIISQINNVVTSFTSGMEAVLGELYARNEIQKLNKVFNYYETMISVIAVPLFSATIVLIVSFVSLYTAKIADTNYIAAAFAFLLTIASLVTCLRSPYGAMIIAAGEFKRTRMAAYGEAAINMLISIVLVIKFGLVGVAIGTVLATLFRWVYYAMFLSKNVLNRSVLLAVKRCAINAGILLISVSMGNWIIGNTYVSSYFVWVKYAIMVTVAAIVVSLVFNCLFYHAETGEIFHRFIPRGVRNAKN